MLKNIFEINIFKFIYFFFCLLSIFPLTMEYCSQISKIFLIWGLIVILFQLYKKRLELIKDNLILCFFYLFIFISCLVNFDNRISNLILFAYCVVQTFILSYKSDKNTFLLAKIIDIYLILSVIFCFISLVILFSHYQNTFTFNGNIMPFGLYEGRLFGAFSNPNVGSFVSWLAIVFSIYKLMNLNANQHFVKYYYFLLIILNFCIMSLGNSRSVMIMFFLTILCVSFLILHNKVKTNILKFILPIIVSIVGLNTMFISNYIMSNINYYCFPNNNEISATIDTENNDIINNDTINNNEEVNKDEGANSKQTDQIENNIIERNYENQNLSNGRLDIWKQGIKLSVSSAENFFLGVGNNNIYNEIMKINPNATSIYSNMHNIYLQILVGSGIMALLSFIVFFIRIFFKYLKYIYINKNIDNYKNSFYWLTIILAFLISGLFDSNLIYFMNVFMTTSFWLIICFFKVDFEKEII